MRKLKAETIDKALQQIREACGVLESDPNIEQFLAFKHHILAGTSIYKNCLMEKAKNKKQQKLSFWICNCQTSYCLELTRTAGITCGAVLL